MTQWWVSTHLFCQDSQENCHFSSIFSCLGIFYRDRQKHTCPERQPCSSPTINMQSKFCAQENENGTCENKKSSTQELLMGKGDGGSVREKALGTQKTQTCFKTGGHAGLYSWDPKQQVHLNSIQNIYTCTCSSFKVTWSNFEQYLMMPSLFTPSVGLLGYCRS